MSPSNLVGRVLVLLLALVFNASCASTPDYVGVRDCAELERLFESKELGQICEQCQGRACSDVSNDCNERFPCEDGKLVFQGCEEDLDCSGLTPARCARYTAEPKKICTARGDDI